jgi:hypothetical protein
MVFWRSMYAAKYLSALALGASERRLLLARVEFACLGHFVISYISAQGDYLDPFL